jgi:mono/diheme cytochrome c family protein
VIAYALTVLLAVLPMPGTQFKQLPNGPGKAEVEAACYACHSADILAQQRLTEKQWLASVEKMVRWGAVVPDAQKDAIVKYLSRHYGPKNRFVPIKTGPVR